MINLSVSSLINYLVVWLIKCQRLMKNGDEGFTKPTVASSVVLFCRR